jgi:hypothetical protein
MPGAEQDVVQVFRESGGEELTIRLKLRALHEAAMYAIKQYAGPMDERSGKGGSDPLMVSRVEAVDRPGQEPPSPNNATQFTGRELMEQGLPVKLPASPHVMWTVYRQFNISTDGKPTGEKP